MRDQVRMAQIPQYFIQDLLNRIDIVDLIQAKMAIKKKGANYHGLCPFHQEKTPSFTVSQPKQFYHCFGCGKHGNAIGFLMDFERLDFIEAVEELARQQGLEVPREQGTHEKKEDFQTLYTLMEKACQFYQDQLKSNPERNRVVQYLKNRGLSGITAKRFSLGLAPNSWDSLLKFLKPTPPETAMLKQIGLMSYNDKGRVFDKFRDRIMFPIHDKRGRVVAFGGRVIDQGEPKYLNSPETPLFHKGKMLYGLFEAKQLHNKFQQILVVEGYMDVVMLAQHGITYAVAALGTATTSDHLRVLKQETQEIIFCFDGDRAGKEAAWRALKVAIPFMTGETDVRFLFVPDGEDPDSLVQKEGKAAFEKRLRTETLSLADFLIRKLEEGLNLKTPAGKSRFMLAFKPLHALLPLGPYKTFLLDTLAHRFNFTFEQIMELLEKPENTPHEHTMSKGQLNLSQKALALLLQNPDLANQGDHTQLSNLPALSDLLTLIQEKTLKTTGQVLEYFRDDPRQEEWSMLAMHAYPSAIQNISQEWLDLIKKLGSDPEAELAALQSLSTIRDLTPEEKEQLKHLLRMRLS